LETNDLFGHVAYIFAFSGMFLLGRKNIWGWPLKAIGNLCWLIIGIRMGMSSIWFWEIVAIFLMIHCYCHWKKEEKQSEEV